MKHKPSMRKAARWKRDGWRFRSVLPSLRRPTLLLCLFLAFHAECIFWLLHQHGNQTLSAAYVLLTLILLFASYHACSYISRCLLFLGDELRDFAFFAPTQLWPLAFRITAFPIASVMLITPAISTWIAIVNKIPSPWLFGLDMAALHAMMIFASLFVHARSAAHPRLQAAIPFVFPYHSLSFFRFSSPIWIYVYIFGSALMERDHFMERLAQHLVAWVEYIMQFSGVGPLVLFWIEPYTLLAYIFLHPGINPGAPFAFGAACLIVCAAISIKLRRWLRPDLAARSTLAYENWMLTRHQYMNRRREILLKISEEHASNPSEHSTDPGAKLLSFSPGISMGNDESAWPESESIEASQDLAKQNQTITQPPDGYTATSSLAYHPEINGDQLLLSKYHGRLKPVPEIGVMITLAIMTAIEAVIPFPFPIAVITWLLLGSFRSWPSSYVSWIVPQRAWPRIWWSLKNRVIPALPLDLILCLIYFEIHGLNLYELVFMFLMVAIGRLYTLSLAISYAQQSARMFVWTLLSMIIGAAFMGAGLDHPPGSEIPLKWIAITAVLELAIVAITWGIMALVIHFRFDDLVHRAKIQPRGQQ